MKKIFHTIAWVAGILGITSCNEKLDIAAPYKNITVVYGMLDITDTAHYIRIQKAFMDGNKSALDMAKIADSSFYNALDVRIKELSAGGAVLRTIKLDKVDLAQEGYPKDTGVFFNTPSYAYKFRESLDAANRYRLVILNTQTGVVDSAETAVIDNTLPNTEFGIREWLDATINMDFSRTTQKFDYTGSIPASVYAAQLVIRFKWVDSNIVTHTSVPHISDFSVGDPDVVAGKPVSFKTEEINLFYFLRSELAGPPEADHYRYFEDSCDMILYAAGEEYYKYLKLNQVSGGLTANEIRPVYTSIKGPDAMGLFSTRGNRQRSKIPITGGSQSALQTNSITSNLGIRFK